MPFADKILVVAPAWVGDLVMAQTLFKLLRQTRPTAQIDVLAPAWSPPLLACMPEVSQVWVMPFAHGELKLKARYQLACQLRQQKYSQAIIVPNSFKSALIPFWAHIPQRTGWRGEMRWGLLNDLRYLDTRELPLMAQRYAALALPASAQQNFPKNLAWPQLQSTLAQQHQTQEKFQLKSHPHPILVLCPGAEYGPAKRWPVEYFAKVAAEKQAAGWQVWIIGAPKEKSLGAQIQQAAANVCVDLTGKTTLGEVIHLLASSDIIITNDSGLMHIAAALNKPLVALYGSTSAAITPPLSAQAQILNLNLSCSPCFDRECPFGHFRCMRELLPDMVLAAIDKFQVK